MVVPQLLESLFLDGYIVTVDVLNTRTTIAQKSIDKSADYVLPLKGNHPIHQGIVAVILGDIATSHALDLSRLRKTTGVWKPAVAGSPPTVPSSLRKTSGRNSEPLCALIAPVVSPTATKPPKPPSSSAVSPPTPPPSPTPRVTSLPSASSALTSYAIVPSAGTFVSNASVSHSTPPFSKPSLPPSNFYAFAQTLDVKLVELFGTIPVVRSIRFHK